MMLLSERVELFEKLYNEWFQNKHFWLDNNLENDKYLTEKYFQRIKFMFECDIEYLKNKSIEAMIGAIIAYDQLPRRFNKLANITDISYSNIYSKIAANISLTILEEATVNNSKYNQLSTDEWFYICMPFRHLDDKTKIDKYSSFISKTYNKSILHFKDE